MIKRIKSEEIEKAAQVIRSSFETVAKEFGLTEQNCPTHTSFIKAEKLQTRFNNGYLMFGYFDNSDIIGFVSLNKVDENTYELNNLAILPLYRHKSYGTELLDFCKQKVKSLNGNKITIGIIEEHIVLKKWYTRNGFKHTGIRQFEHLPFTVGFMECVL